MTTFVYEALPMRVRFGPGERREVLREVEHLGLSRVLVLTTDNDATLTEDVMTALGSTAVGTYDRARMHVPVETVGEARDVAARVRVDGYLAIGGGSTIGLAKALALETGIPVIAVPTTYAGSEMTTIWGTTCDGVKTTGRDPRVLPRSVIYDPELTVTLPVALSVASAFNAVAHAVEGLYAPNGSPMISSMAEDGVRLLLGALPDVVTRPTDLSARSDALQGAWLCGAVLGAATMSLHHKLCHVLGGTFGLSHAETHTVVLPYVLAFNAPAIPRALAAIRRASGFVEPAAELRSMSVRLGMPGSLAQLGLEAGDLDRAVELATKNAYANPRAATATDVRSILEAALVGADV